MIAVVYPECFEVQGIARYVDSFLANLPCASPPIVLITGDREQVSRSYAGVEIVQVPFSSNRFKQALWGMRVRRRLLALYREGRIRWLNLHIPPLLPQVLMPAEIPVVVTAHTTSLGISGNFYPERYYECDWSPAALAMRTWMERRILAKATRVITLTEQGRQEIARVGFTGPVTVIPNGADAHKFTPDFATPKDIDVLFCGRIERRKGSRAMVELCETLIAQRPSIRICIVGDGVHEYQRVRAELAAYRDNVSLAGKVGFDRMRSFYNRSRVYVSTSFYEGLPGTCLEAMSMALPVVGWDFLFYTDVVQDGRTGYLVPANDFGMMSARVLHLLENDAVASAMGRTGQALFLARYDWRRLASDVLGEFR